ncbi:MAG: type III-A CRISPR-associated RAMP protein Csm4 [Halobacteriota archaeon]
MDIVYLKPKSLFPTNLPSNTIFGAICIAIKEIYGEDELDRILDLFDDESNPFVLSSAFPFVNGSDGKHHFFPKLIVEPFEEPITNYWDQAKKFKGVRWIHQDIFNDWINGKLSELDVIKTFDERYKLKSGLLFHKGTDLEYEIIVADVAHNQLNRLSNRSENFFYSTGAYFRNVGLFFLIEFFNKSYESKVMSALKFIEDRGIGGDISSGQGQFEIDGVEDRSITTEPAEADAFTTLSLYSPDSEFSSYNKSQIWYELVKIQGRCEDGAVKKPLFMFKEGSTFPILDQKFYGKTEEVRPKPQRAIEYGIAFPIKMRR